MLPKYYDIELESNGVNVRERSSGMAVSMNTKEESTPPRGVVWVLGILVLKSMHGASAIFCSDEKAIY